MQSLKGKVALVTGASDRRGMGYAAAAALAEAGASVVITDRVAEEGHRAALARRADELAAAGAQVLALPMDVTSREQVEEVIAATLAHFGALHILFNNAGSPAGVGDFLTMSEAQWDVSYQVNLKGVVNVCQLALPHLIAAGGGAVINNASLSGLGAVAQMAAYTATKFAVVGLTKALAAEFGAAGVRVNAVCPGMIWTQMGEQEVAHNLLPGETLEQAKARLVSPDVVPAARWGQAAEVAQAVVYLASDGASYINGVALPVAGGLAPGL